MNQLNIRSFGLALGIAYGAGAFLLGILALLFGWGTVGVQFLSQWYIGFAPTLLGSIIGGVWGFFNGLVCGVVIAWLYNKFEK